MKSTAFFQFLNNNISISDQKELFESIRLDPIIWEALLNNNLIHKIVENYGKSIENWMIGKICLLGIGLSTDILSKPIREKLYLKKAIILFENARNNASQIDNLEAATLLALALYERGLKAQNWNGLLSDLGIQKFENRSQFVNCWRTPLAILYSFLDCHDDLLVGIASDKDDNLSISLINHIIAVQLFSKTEKVNILKRLVEKSNLTKQISWYQSFPTQLGFLVPDISEGLHQTAQFNISNDKNLFSSYKNIEDQIQENILFGYKNLLEKSNNQAHAHFLAAKSVSKKLQDYIDLLCLESNQPEDFTVSEGKDPFFEDILLSNYDDAVDLNQFRSDSIEPKGILLKLSSLVELMNKGEQNRAKELAIREFDFWLNQRKNNWPAIDEIELIQRIDHKKIIEYLKELKLTSQIENFVNFLDDISKNNPNINPVILDSFVEFAGAETQYEKLKVGLAISPQNKKIRSDLMRLLAQKCDWETLYEEWEHAETNGEIEGGDWIKYALTACKAGKLETAQRLCDKLSSSGADEGQILAIKGKISFLNGDLVLAKTQLSESLRITTDLADAWLTLAEIYSQENNFYDAISTLRSAVLSVPDSHDIHYAMASACLANNQYAEALPYLKKAIALNPENEKYIVDYVKTLKELGHFEEANNFLSKGRSKWPLNSELAYMDAKRSLEKGEKEQALLAFKDAINNSEKPEYEWLMTYAITLLNDDQSQFSLTETSMISIENLAAAQKVLQKIVINNGNRQSYANILLGEVYYLLNEIEAAHSVYLELVNLIKDPQTELSEWEWRILAGMGLVKIALQENEVGLVMLKDAAIKNPNHIGLKQALAQAFFDMKLEDDSIRTAKEAFTTGSTNVRTLVWYSDFMKKLNQIDEVIKALENANLLSNYDEEISLKLANEYVSVGNTVNANTTLDSILQKDISDYDLLRKTTTAFLRLSNFEKAYISYKKGLVNLHQLSIENQIEYIYLCYKNEKWQETLDQVQRLISQNYGFIATYVIQAESLAGINQYGAALNAYEQAAQLKRKLVDYIKFKNISEMFVPIDWIAELEKEETVISKLALAAISANEFEKSLKSIDQVIQLQPENANYKLFGADISLQLNDFETAKKYLGHPDLGKMTENDEVQSSLYEGLNHIIEMIIGNPKRNPNYQLGSKNIITNFIDINEKFLELNYIGAKNSLDKFMQVPLNNDQLSIIGMDKALLSQAWKNTFFRLAIKVAIDLEEFSLANELISNWTEQKGSSIEIALYSLISLSAYSLKSQIYSEMKIRHHRAAKLEDALVNKSLFDQFFAKAISQGKTEILKDYELAKSFSTKADFELIKSKYISKDFSSVWKYILVDRLMQLDYFEATEKLLLENQATLVDFQMFAKYLMKKDPYKIVTVFLEKNLVSDPISCQILSVCFSETGNLEQAITFSDKATEIWPMEEMWKVENALLFEKIGDSEASFAKWEKIIQQAESIQEVIYPYLDLLLRDGKYERVIKLLDLYKKNLEFSYQYQKYLAKAFFIGEKFDEALKAIHAAKEIEPNDEESLVIEGKIYLSQNQIEKAKHIANTIIQKNANCVAGYLLLVSTYESQKKFVDANKILDEALGFNPNNHELLLNKVWNLRELGNLAEALSIASQMSVSNTSDWESLSLLALLYNDLEDYRAAEENAKKSLRISIDQPGLMMLLGQILRKQGHLDQAIEYFSKAAVESPQIIEPCLEIGDIYFDQQNFAEALDAYQEAINRNESDARPFYKAGLIMKEIKDYQSAEKMLKIASGLAPKDANIRRQLAGVIALNFVHSPLEVK